MLEATIGALLLVSCVWPLSRARRELSGTTLLGAWYWAAAGWGIATVAQTVRAVSLAAGGVAAIGAGPQTHLDYVVVALVLCAATYVLGARRPAAGPWHLVVATLAVVLLMPAGESLLRGRLTYPLVLDEPRSILCAMLVVVGLGNYVPTRFGPTAVLLGAALSCSLLWVSVWTHVWAASVLPRAGEVAEPVVRQASVGLSGLAAWTAYFFGRRTVRADAGALERLWRGYRDLFGVVWAARLAERFNSFEKQFGWKVRLGWRGIEGRETAERASETKPRDGREARSASGAALGAGASPAAGDARDEPAANFTELQGLRWLLRRFVSDAWIERRVE